MLFFIIQALDNVFWFLSNIWCPYELFAGSFMGSVATLEYGFSSLSLRAFFSDWTKLLKPFEGVYWTNRCDWVHLSLRSGLKFKGGVMIVPLIFSGSYIMAFSEVESRVCFLLHTFAWIHQNPSEKPKCFWKLVETLQIFLSSCLELKYYIERNQTFHHCNFLTVKFGKPMLAWREKLLLQKAWFHHSLLDDVYIDASTSHW